MKDVERLLLECRYILSIKKSFKEIAHYLGVREEVVYNDIMNILPKYDKTLNFRVKERINH